MAVFNQEVPVSAKMAPDARFKFQCHPEGFCPTECSRDSSLCLSPYDIIRLKKHLGLTSTEFLDRFTRRDNDEQSFLPLIFLDLSKSEGRCPFLEVDSGHCHVYSDRPASCRLYPLAQSGELIDKNVKDYFYCRQEQGSSESQADQEWSVASWLSKQDLELFLELSRDWRAMVLWMGQKSEIKTPPQVQALFQMVAYDVDKFRRFVFETAFLEIFQISGPYVDNLKNDDLELLKLGYKYLKMTLLMENSLHVEEEVLRAANPTDASTKGYTTF